MRPLHTPARQRGVAALLVTTLLCFAMILVVAYASRNIVVEERVSASQYRAAQAFEAAEAGVEWALSRLNDTARVGPDCRPSGAAAALSSRKLWLRFQSTAGSVSPATWSDAGTAVPLRAACVRGEGGWTCSCPSNGAPALAEPSQSATAPAFVIEFEAGSRPGLVRVVATGCTRLGACSANAPNSHEATARVESVFALLPSLRAAPAAALTVRGNIDAGAAALGAHNRDAASNGLAVLAGGNVAASALRLTAPAGSSLAGAVASGDATLAALDGDRFFTRFFGMSEAAWAAQPAVSTVACAGDCTAALATAIDAGARLLFVDGDAALAGPATFGSPDDPVAIVARGAISVTGSLALHGIVHGAALRWDNAAAPGALVRGAALVAGDYAGNGGPDFAHDGAVLARLQTRAGSFVRVNGSWKDF